MFDILIFKSKKMKKLVLILCMCLTASFVTSQSNQKNNARAEKAIALIASEMSNLNDSEIEFIKQAFLDKYTSNGKATAVKGLSKEQKRAIFRKSRDNTKNTLLEKFSNSQANKILKLENQSFQTFKPKNK
tara:strand:- start:465 stop:857 length:393 start_codon:yes stop_codon:yes gene_type:complete